MSLHLKIKKGRDLNIAGGIVDAGKVTEVKPRECAVVPDDFHGLILKLEVKEGDAVPSGAPLLHDKADDRIKVVSPVSGTVKAVVRGERRKIERVVIEPTGAVSPLKHVVDSKIDAEGVRNLLMVAGLWAMMRQRPYDIVPIADSVPRDIFVTGIDSAPLAVNPTAWISDSAKVLAKGVEALAKLTSGKVYVSRRPGELADVPGAEMVDVEGPHPAGNVGVQIAAIRPVNKGETVWTLDLDTLRRIGSLMTDGIVPMDTMVAVTGSEVENPHMVKTVIGADIASILGSVADEHVRIISGNVLTGVKVSREGFLRFPWHQITVIPEGDNADEFMGWASISPKKMSASRSFPGKFLTKVFRPDARINGGHRALIMSGEYDRYLPMDIMAEYLLKAIIGGDIEKMEQLGIYEVAPEDFALGEWADTSKIEAQKIVREGLDRLRKELM